MKKSENEDTQQKGRSNISYAIMSLVFPGMGQIVRGRVLAGLLFLLNVSDTTFPAEPPQLIHFICIADRIRQLVYLVMQNGNCEKN